MRFQWALVLVLPWIVLGKKHKQSVFRLTNGEPDVKKKEKARNEVNWRTPDQFPDFGGKFERECINLVT